MFLTQLLSFSALCFKGDALVLTVDPTEYMDRLVDYCMVKVYAVIRVKETNQLFSEEDDFSLTKPALKIEPVGRIQSGRMSRIRLSFLNPLQVRLTECRITLECPGVFAPLSEKVEDVRGAKMFSHEALVVPRTAKNSTIVACFTSREMIDVHGSAKLEFNQP